MLKMEGFVGAITATIGHRMVTISAWDSPEASRQVMKQGTHSVVMKSMYEGTVAKHGYTSVCTKHRINPVLVRCEAYAKMTRAPGDDRLCACGTKLPDPAPFW